MPKTPKYGLNTADLSDVGDPATPTKLGAGGIEGRALGPDFAGMAQKQQAAITATAPARKQAQARDAQRGHDLAQSISDNIGLQAGPEGQSIVAHSRERLENDRYNALTPDQRSAEYGAKVQKLQDIAKDPLSHGAQPTSVLTDVEMHKQHIKELSGQLEKEPAAGGVFSKRKNQLQTKSGGR